MKTIAQIRRENLAIAIKRARSAKFLAELADTSEAYLSQLKNAVPNKATGVPRFMGDDLARRIEQAIGEETGWMDFDRTDTSTASDDVFATSGPADISAEAQVAGSVVAWEEPTDLPSDPDRVWIDRYDYFFSAGKGLIQWEVREKSALPFSMSFFRGVGSNPKDCKLLIVRGDSMEPFLFNRDTIMIDTAKLRIRDGAVYAIYFEDEPLVKRIHKQAGGGIVLNSYNSAKYPDKVIAPEQMEFVRIVGEVIHRSGSGPAGGN
ncbi:S24 family peptidase [Burkholderia glumae]|uniref:S24 family peptidase n=1 Tax=Burkholderia glumae TaxID=337 RepID=UPI0021517571|nr:S24 family peptidase [Burkholderia glumae]